MAERLLNAKKKMNKTESIKLNKDFKRLYYRGKSVVRQNIVVYINPNRKGVNRLGLTCGKAVGKAVKRNRVKRLMRESYRLIEDNIKTGYDIVIVARSRSVNCKYMHISNDLVNALNKLGLIENNDKDSDCNS